MTAASDDGAADHTALPSKITVRRSGGFAGIEVTSQVTDAKDIAELVAALQPLRASSAPSKTRDGFVYEFEFISASGTAIAPPTPAFAESQIPEDVRRLLR